MNIIFLTQQLNGLTGGVIYDQILFDKLRDRFGDQVKLIDDNSFGDEFSEETTHYKRFDHIYKNHAKDITSCDYLFINSRLYTCFTSFPWKEMNPKCKIVLIHHHFNYMTQKNMMKYVVHRHLEMAFLKRAACIITPNPYTLDILIKKGLKSKSIIIESFINNEIHTSKEEKKNQLLFMGTVEARKGVDLGIDAFYLFSKNHPEYNYLIAGTFRDNTPFCQELVRKVQSYGLENKVKFLGRVEDEEKERLYRESKLFLFPSLNEGYGWVIVEAMSYGMPVVCFNNTAMPYTVNQNNGAVVQNKNIDEMASALERILDNNSEYNRLSQGALQTVQNLPSKEHVNKEYEKFFESIERHLV